MKYSQSVDKRMPSRENVEARLSIDIRLAMKLGVEAALMLEVIHRLLAESGGEAVDLTWQEWHEALPMYSVRTLQRVAEKLQKDGHIDVSGPKNRARSFQICDKSLMTAITACTMMERLDRHPEYLIDDNMTTSARQVDIAGSQHDTCRVDSLAASGGQGGELEADSLTNSDGLTDEARAISPHIYIHHHPGDGHGDGSTDDDGAGDDDASIDEDAERLTDEQITDERITDMSIDTENRSSLESVRTEEQITDKQIRAEKSKAGPASRRGRPRAAAYSWEHYEWDAATWAAIREGNFPENERPASVLVGAYLLGMKLEHGVTTAVLAPEFNGKIGAIARNCIDYFTAVNGGDELAGFNAALDYVRWYITNREVAFIVEKGRSINLCFSSYGYRDAYQEAKIGENLTDERKKGALRFNRVGVILTHEERAKNKGLRM